MKPFNKVTTVKLNMNAEVLPLSVSFVARAMQAKSCLERRNSALIDALSETCTADMDKLVAATQADIAEVIDFFACLYTAIVDDEPVQPSTAYVM